MSSKPLWQKLQALQCHFTWDFEVKDKVDAEHNLQTLALKAEHTEYRNRGVYLATKAYLYHLQRCYKEALASLQEAEEVLRLDHPANFSCQALVTYGDYAWVYYRLANYEMVELYLGRVRQVCQSLNSPEPYSAQVPEVHAQKGWSLLAVGLRNGEEAEKCFQAALRGDESNREFQAGRAFSAFARWTHSWSDDDRKEAARLMGNVVHRGPPNMEAKACLASLLKKTDPHRSVALMAEVAQNSLNPELLRRAYIVYKLHSLPEAVGILRQAVALAPGFHLLHYDLGVCYKTQLEGAAPEERDGILATAIESFQRAVEADPHSIFSRLELAQVSGEKAPIRAEEMYLNLLEELPAASKRCQQAIRLHWGDFLLHRKGRRREALETYKAGFVASDVPTFEWKQLRKRLMNLARAFEEDSERNEAKAIYRVIGPSQA